MLGILRNAAGTWVAKALLSLLVISFAVWGISGRLSGTLGGHHSVITAGGTTAALVNAVMPDGRTKQPGGELKFQAA